ncbi:unnamed protein product [Allacma fusca]|uniref:Carboxylesterase type B domain-containing protein n=1 Tax=Allacma fusca TaxID=39272 RepID=A0A8J2JYZ6_9HEXA|nr:unnamed protein product [Allacma fusca]
MVWSRPTMSPILLLLFISLPALLCSMRQWSPRVVTTKLGLVRGFLFLPKNYEGVEVFLGIPYASAPVNTLRFMPPVEGSPWPGTKMTEYPAPVCPQVHPDIFNETEALKTMPRGRLNILKRLLPQIHNQSEDCLYLNVYCPLSGESQFIHFILITA